MKGVLLACIVTLFIQIFLGTQVRESIDRIAALRGVRETWISQLGLSFLIHRSFSMVVLLLHLILLVKLKKTRENNPLSLGLIVLLLGTFLTGAGMAYWAVPACAATDPFSTGGRSIGNAIAAIFSIANTSTNSVNKLIWFRNRFNFQD